MFSLTFCLCFVFSCQLLDMKIFVDTDSDIRLVRRLRRDITERGRDIEGVIKQYNKFVKPAFEQYIEPTMRLADIVVPRGACIFHTHIFIYTVYTGSILHNDYFDTSNIKRSKPNEQCHSTVTVFKYVVFEI